MLAKGLLKLNNPINNYLMRPNIVLYYFLSIKCQMFNMSDLSIVL